MRKKVIAGNWKMNKDLSESVSLISELINGLNNESINSDVIVCPPFISLETAKALIKNSNIKLGAQNLSNETAGAFTGEISAPMLASVGCEYVIIGHSERRAIYGESDELINSKIHKAFEFGLKPIFCIGESLNDREQEITENVVEKQLSLGLNDVNESQMGSIIVAYEPIWAIGTGKTATPDQAQDVHRFIRNFIKNKYSEAIADGLVIQYGGSVKPSNAEVLLSQPDIDGALIGGACLDHESFISIIKSA